MSVGTTTTTDDGGVPQLKRERARFAAFAFCWGDILFELSPDGKVLCALGAIPAFVGRTAAELQGTAFLDLAMPSEQSSLERLLKSIRRLGRVDGEMVRVKGRSGLVLPMSLAGYCLDPAGGSVYLALRLIGRRPGPGAEVAAPEGMVDPAGFVAVASERIKAMHAAKLEAEVSLLAIPGLHELRGRLDETGERRLMNGVRGAISAAAAAGASVEVAEGRYGMVHDRDLDVPRLGSRIQNLVRSLDSAAGNIVVETSTLPGEAVSEMAEDDLIRGLTYAVNRFREAAPDHETLSGLTSQMAMLMGTSIQEVGRLRKVVAEGGFDIALHPVIDATTGIIDHFEALCRFQVKKGADDSPAKTIAFAEETGLIHDLDLAMLAKVVARMGGAGGPRMAVNVSGRSAEVPAYVDGLKKLLEANPWIRGRLLFEITESARIVDLEAANAFIQVLRGWGCAVCLDDFGAGAASFPLLSVLDVDMVKLDGAALRLARRGPKGEAFLAALTELCRRLGIKTIAEMVDDAAGLTFARDGGCDYVQGFLFGKPARDEAAFKPLPQAGLFKGR